MKLALPRGRRARMAWGAVALAGTLAVSARWLDRLRLVSPERLALRQIRVVNGADAGPGTLREAIFAADRADGRARVVIEVPRIVLETPLPPLVNPEGVVVDARSARTRLDARKLTDGPVLDVAAPNSAIIGLRIEHAPDQALLIRKSGARVESLAVENSQVGVYLTDGADDLVLSDSEFKGNDTGVQLPADASRVRLQNNRFSGHRRAAVWAVAPAPLPPGRRSEIDILHNRFENDYQPLVLVNATARVERNVVQDAHAAAVYASGARAIIRGNRLRAGRGFGIYADNLQAGLISDNEIDHNCSGGVIVRGARNTRVVFNRLYANGYGIVLVLGDPSSPNTIADNLVIEHVEDGLYVIGGSPILRHNRLLQNRRAGLRLSALRADGRRTLVPEPLMDANVVSGNGSDGLRRDDYRPLAADLGALEPADCSWRRIGPVGTPVHSTEERR